VIDHKIDGNQRPHSLDVKTSARHRRAHRGEIDEKWDSSEILQQYATDDERHLRCARGARLPLDERFDVLITNAVAVQSA
jgi:hypothetical protein